MASSFAMRILFGKRKDFCLLANKGLDHTDPGEAFLYKVGKIGNTVLTFGVEVIQYLSVMHIAEADDDHRDQCQKGQFYIDIIHHLADDQERHDYGIKDADDSRAKCHADRI